VVGLLTAAALTAALIALQRWSAALSRATRSSA
jgi:hypothetical protein